VTRRFALADEASAAERGLDQQSSSLRRLATEKTEPRWGLGDAAAGFLVGLVLSTFLASIWLAGQGPDAEDLSLGGQALSAIGLWVGLAGAAVLATRRKGNRSLAEDFGLRAEPVDLAVGLGAGVFAQLLLIPLIALILSPLLGDPDVSTPVEDLLDTANGPGKVGLFLFVAVGAPIVEELFFRGLLLRSLLRRTAPVWAVVISGLLFGLAHPQDLPLEALVLVMVSLAALGMLLGFLAVRFGRLGPAIVAHSVFNAWTLIVLLNR
jgi:membrane protease YdiL (CAAX protease family)